MKIRTEPFSRVEMADLGGGLRRQFMEALDALDSRPTEVLLTPREHSALHMEIETRPQYAVAAYSRHAMFDDKIYWLAGEFFSVPLYVEAVVAK